MFIVTHFLRFPFLRQEVVFMPSDAPKANRRSIFKNEIAIRVKFDEAFLARRSFMQEFKRRYRLGIFGQKLGGKFKPAAFVITGRLKVRWQRFNLNAGKVNPSRLVVPRPTLPEILTVKDGTDE